MEYEFHDVDDENNYNPIVSCNYILPNQIAGSKLRNHLTILSFNIRSMFQNFNNFKVEIFQSGILDVIGFCESHLTDDIQSLYMLPNYNCYTTNVLSNKGGVCLFVRKNINSKIRVDLCLKTDHFEAVFAELIIGNQRVVVVMCYRRPGTSTDLFTDDLSTLLGKIHCDCIIMGDLNINLLNHNNDNNVNLVVDKFHEFLFYPTVTKPTRVNNSSATLLDHVWINFGHSNIQNSNIVFTGITDHFPTIYYYMCNNSVPAYKTIRYRLSGEECDQRFTRKLQSHNFNDVFQHNDVNMSFESFNGVWSSYYNECYPLKSKNVAINKIKNPWITSGLKQSIKNKNKLYKKYIKMPITYGDQYRAYRNSLSKLIKSAKFEYYRNKFGACDGNIKSVWKNINKILGKNHRNSINVFKINNAEVSDKLAIAEAFNEYYGNVARNIEQSLPQPNQNFHEYLPNRNFDRMEWNETTTQEIIQLLRSMNCTSAGPDEIPTVIIKKNANILAPTLSRLCNLSLNSGIFPSIHKAGNIIPLYKNKDISSIENYRPICLLNAVSKLLEKVVASRLIEHLENNNILSEKQYAYRKKRGTDTALLRLVNDVVNNFERGNVTVAAFIDLTKAFDCVNHGILLRKLSH